MSSWFINALLKLTRHRPSGRDVAQDWRSPADGPREIDVQLPLDFQDDTMPAAFNGLEAPYPGDRDEQDDAERHRNRDHPRRRA